MFFENISTPHNDIFLRKIYNFLRIVQLLLTRKDEMYKKLFVTILTLLTLNSIALADCTAGYACSIKDLENQIDEQSANQKEKEKSFENGVQKDKINKKDSNSVDGKENNSPEYTEIFTLKGIF